LKLKRILLDLGRFGVKRAFLDLKGYSLDVEEFLRKMK